MAGICCFTNDLTQRATGVMTTACRYKEIQRNTGNPIGEGALPPQPDAREGQAQTS